MAKWQTFTVDQLIDFGILYRPIDGNHGSIHPKTSDFVESGIPFVMASDLKDGQVDLDGCSFISEQQARRLAKGFSLPGDVLLSHKATIGRTAVVQQNKYPFIMLTPQVTYYRVKDREKLRPRFLKYYFDSAPFKEILDAWAGAGSTRAYLGITEQRKLPVPLPPPSVQASIESVIGPLEDKIDLNRRMNETLEAIARAIFKDWFVDFGPVRAKTKGSQPPGLPSDIAALFPDALDDEDKPLGWARATLATFADLNPDSWSAATRPTQIEYVDLSNTKWGRIEATQRFNQADAPSRAQRVLQKGDTIVGTVRPGNGSYALVSRSGLTGSTGFAVLRAREGSASELVYLAATSQSNIERLAHLADGGAYPAVRPDVVLATEIVNVPPPIVETFSRLVEPFLGKIAHNESESDNLVAVRDLLLPKLMSGEIRIRDAESVVANET